ncbi:TPA: hypothetical protein ACGXP3_005359 [Bacillus cereus]
MVTIVDSTVSAIGESALAHYINLNCLTKLYEGLTQKGTARRCGEVTVSVIN